MNHPVYQASQNTSPTYSPSGKERNFFEGRFPRLFSRVEGWEYGVYDVHLVDRAYISSIRSASKQAFRIYKKMLPLLCSMPDEMLINMGIPSNILSCVRIGYKGIEETVVGRFDFVVTPNGPKIIEFNAETPFFYIESYRVAGEIVRELGLVDPNKGEEEALGRALASSVKACYRGGRVVVTGHEAGAEDCVTARYAADILQSAIDMKIDFSPLQKLKIFSDGLYDSNGRIDILYRFYPMELFAADKGGLKFSDLLAKDKLRVINPPCALLLQNKGLQVLIWGFYERGIYFNEEEREIISSIFLPSYAELPDDEFDYVRKPIFGREGNSVEIFYRNGERRQALMQNYAGQPMIFQRRVDLPKVSYMHPRTGLTSGYAITTCFVAAGEPSAVGMRVGDEITDIQAQFLPLAYPVS